ITVLPTSNPFNKQGGSILTLNGTNTFSGPTSINGGTLVVNGALNSSGTVTVNSGTTLGGTGVIAGPVSLQSGGTLTVGKAGAGAFTLGGLTLAPGSTGMINVALGSLTNSANGVLQVSGNVTLAGQLGISDLGGFT